MHALYASVDIELASVASFGLSFSNKVTSGNTITVTFVVKMPSGAFFKAMKNP